MLYPWMFVSFLHIQDPVAGCEIGDGSDVDFDPQHLEGSSGEDLNSSSGDEFCFLENEVPSQVNIVNCKSY